MTQFNERIYELRKEGGFTQEEIAAELNVSRQTVSNWETGTAQPTIDKAIELANLYGVSMDELIGKNIKIKNKPSKLLLSLLNQRVTLLLSPESDVLISFPKTEIKDCEIIEVNPSSIRIIMNEKKQRVEKLVFLKDVLGFEREAR